MDPVDVEVGQVWRFRFLVARARFVMIERIHTDGTLALRYLATGYQHPEPVSVGVLRLNYDYERQATPDELRLIGAEPTEVTP